VFGLCLAVTDVNFTILVRYVIASEGASNVMPLTRIYLTSIPFLVLLSLQFLRSFVRRGSGNCRSDASVNLRLSHFSWTCDNSGSKGALYIQTKFISDPSYLLECKTLEDRAPYKTVVEMSQPMLNTGKFALRI
jgi:hypothetical protein